MEQLEDDFYRKVNEVISTRVTPLYNTFILIFASIFGYFLFTEENQCFAKEQTAYGVQYAETEDVSKQFYMLCYFGMILLIFSAILYHL